MRQALSYQDAIVILGGDPPAVAALDKALGGALSLATGGISDSVLDLFDAQHRIIGLGRDVTQRLRGRLPGAGRMQRTQRLEAACTIITVTAYFEALGETELPFDLRKLDLTRADQLRLAAGGEPARELVDTLTAIAPPHPAPHLAHERLLEQLEEWYAQVSPRMLRFVQGLAVWDELTPAERHLTEQRLGEDLARASVARFTDLYAQLVADVPEFKYWTYQLDHQATRAEVHSALTGVEAALTALSQQGAQAPISRALANAYRGELSRPILAEGNAGMRTPTLEEAYLDPDFRVRPVSDRDSPADDDSWTQAVVRSDLSTYLVGALTTTDATYAPLLVLGQPGAGKSVLTKILAARLPVADLVPVRVVLREVPSEADIQDQIEQAIRGATGERVEWPDFARAIGPALPVILLDGLDELLQATGVSQSDYLMKVARFQQREAQQDRPVAVVVTSRTAVADRVRYPDGVVALRLEPFRREQIAEWVARWNRYNADHFAARNLSPLAVEAVFRQEALSAQPLLLMMLALYDSQANALQKAAARGDGRPIDESTLYEELLTAFAVRETEKDGPALLTDRPARVEAELQRLSLVAFAMINRRRQWVAEADLDADLVAVIGPRALGSGQFRTPLNQAEIALGRFFFIQRAQAVRDGSRLLTFEFLHATFGEFLVARLAVQLTAGLLTQRSALAVGTPAVDDELLYALLSFAPLSTRQQLRFVRGCADRMVPAADRPRLAAILTSLTTASESRTRNQYAAYCPEDLPVASRHGVYSANLVLLTLVFASRRTAREFFPASPDPAGTWHRRTLLWRSALTEQSWTDFALALDVGTYWDGDRRDLRISLNVEPRGTTQPVDLYWHYRYPPGHEQRNNVIWRRAFVEQATHKMHVAGGTNDSTFRHALEPLLHRLEQTVMTFMGVDDRAPTSIAHDLLRLWMASSLAETTEELEDAYARCIRVLGILSIWGPEFQDVVLVVLRQLRADVPRLAPRTVVGCLRAAHRVSGPAGVAGDLIYECAMLALDGDVSAEERADLAGIVSFRHQ